MDYKCKLWVLDQYLKTLVFTTGIFTSGYFVGYFVGSKTTPNFVSKGHIRVFAAFASLASLSALVAVVYVNPFMWTISRFITGMFGKLLCGY